MPDRVKPGSVALAGLAALAVAMGIGRFAFTPILPMMQQDAGLSVAAGGWLASANYVGYLLGALTVAQVRIGAAAAIRASLVAIGLVTLGMGLTDSFTAWVLLRALAGVASAWVLVCVSAWSMEKLAPFRRPMLGATVFAGVGVGIAAAGGLCLALDARGQGFRRGMGAAGRRVAAGGGTGLARVRAGRAGPAGAARERNTIGLAGRLAAADPLLRQLRLRLHHSRDLPAGDGARGDPDPAVFGWSWPVFGEPPRPRPSRRWLGRARSTTAASGCSATW